MSSIKSFYENQMKELGNQIKNFPWEDEKAYADWLSQTYYFVRESTRLLMLAGSRFSVSDENLHKRFIDHTSEERGHEKMLMNDLKGLNRKNDPLPEKSITKSFYQCQYYGIEHQTPFSFFGYIIFLEGIAVMFGEDVYDRVVAAHGAKAATFLKVHAHEDPDHVEKALNELNKLPENLIEVVKNNYTFSQEIYSKILNECSSKVSLKQARAS